MTQPPADCLFYHTVSLPGGEVRGQWDLRARTREYLGNVAFDARSVLELGPASGYLSFHMEAAGARVTCVEPTMARLWDVVPLAGFDIAAWRREFEPMIAGVRKSFWFLHRLYGSAVRVVEAEPYDLPAELGRFDIGVMTSLLLHCRDPFSLVESVARHIDDTLIVTEPYIASLGDEPVCRFLPHGRGDQVHTWWQFTPRYFASVFEVLGFARTTVTRHAQWSETNQAAVDMFTVVGRR
ncbi:MAG: class I SAM-dependent methyltransferase [Alphaproteobacteria bacterium]|nr:class I SAM-dependent methyltransferase [Alphaproteobacteria bacterium]